jgi:hypothetical protein
MSRDLSTELKAAYDHATMRNLAQRLKSGPQWKAVQDIQKRHQAARTTETNDYRETYDQRVAVERQALLRKRGQVRHEPRPPVANDRFNKSSLEHQAHKNVRNAHQQSLARIDAAETKELKTLTERAGVKPEASVKASFTRTQAQAPR